MMSVLNFVFNQLKDKLDDACEHGEIGNSERILSVISGGFILGVGLKKLFHSPLTGFSGMALGGGLIYRGISGKCAIKGAINAAKEEDEKVTVVEHRYFVK
ncbi:DUF2892 domain-containing protein [Sphingobacterium sp. KB22]|uniref:DUF2892 domain-containing protein n=2 Tax=Sphingobacterium hungaricum TaxID=2082723 RepID=A0A928UYM0_9SPHI|nr:DUF2892 domain-containing protein [Sphingobacterium hungaricum]